MTTPREHTNHLAALLRREHAALADFLLALVAFDRERGWLELGHASLFAFLHRELGLSKGAAYYRKVAADLVRSFPEVVEPIRDGRLCITSVMELAKVLTPENRAEVLPRFFHRSKQEAKAVSAELRPAEAAPHRDVVTTLARTLAVPGAGGTPVARSTNRHETPALDLAPSAVHPDEPILDRAQLAVHPGEPATLPASAATTAAAPAMPRDVAEPLTADLRRLHITVSRRFLSKLDAARDALSHARPEASTEEVLEAALDLLIEAHAKRKAALVEKPRRLPAANEPAPAVPPATRHVPAAVRRGVWTRDQGRCQWPLATGGTCGSTCRVEFDHVVPLARGGASTIDNVRILCRAHNQAAARQAFGDEWMDRFSRAARTCAGARADSGHGG